MTTLFADAIPQNAVLLDRLEKKETPLEMYTSIEGLRNHLDNNHVIVMAEIETMQLKLRKILKEVLPAYTMIDATPISYERLVPAKTA